MLVLGVGLEGDRLLKPGRLLGRILGRFYLGPKRSKQSADHVVDLAKW